MRKHIALATISAVLAFNQVTFAQHVPAKLSAQVIQTKIKNMQKNKMATQLIANLITLRQSGDLTSDLVLRKSIREYLALSTAGAIGAPSGSAAVTSMSIMLNNLLVGGEDFSDNKASAAIVSSLAVQSVLLLKSDKIIDSQANVMVNAKKTKSNEIATKAASTFSELLYLDSNDKEQLRYKLQTDLLTYGKTDVIQTLVSLGFVFNETAELLNELSHPKAKTQEKATDIQSIAEALYRSSHLLSNLQASKITDASLKTKIDNNLAKTEVLLKQYSLTK